jgi:hypothetical protein
MEKKSKQKPAGSIFRVVTAYPQASVRRAAYIVAKNRKEIDKDLVDSNPEDFAIHVDVDINYGGEAHTESINELKESEVPVAVRQVLKELEMLNKKGKK